MICWRIQLADAIHCGEPAHKLIFFTDSPSVSRLHNNKIASTTLPLMGGWICFRREYKKGSHHPGASIPVKEPPWFQAFHGLFIPYVLIDRRSLHAPSVACCDNLLLSSVGFDDNFKTWNFSWEAYNRHPFSCLQNRSYRQMWLSTDLHFPRHHTRLQ